MGYIRGLCASVFLILIIGFDSAMIIFVACRFLLSRDASSGVVKLNLIPGDLAGGLAGICPV